MVRHDFFYFGFDFDFGLEWLVSLYGLCLWFDVRFFLLLFCVVSQIEIQYWYGVRDTSKHVFPSFVIVFFSAVYILKWEGERGLWT